MPAYRSTLSILFIIISICHSILFVRALPALDGRVEMAQEDAPFPYSSIMDKLSLKDQVGAVVSRQLREAFNDRSSAEFVKKFGYQSMGKLIKYENDLKDEFIVKVVKSISPSTVAHWLNFLAYSEQWRLLQIMLQHANGARAEFLAYSIRRAAAHGLDENLAELRVIVNDDELFNSIISDRLNIDRDRFSQLAADLEPYLDVSLDDIKTLDKLLFITSERDSPELLKMLLHLGADLNPPVLPVGSKESIGVNDFETSLDQAALDIKYDPLTDGAGSNIHPFIHGSPLHEAVRQRNIDLVRELLALGADPNLDSEFFATPLHIAVENGDVDILHELLINGGNPNIQSSSSPDTLLSKALKGDIELVRELLANGADPNGLGHSSGSTPLHYAADIEDIELVRLLLKYGADPNSKDFLDFTPLFYAVAKGNVQIMHELLTGGADPNHTNLFGSPLREAVKERKIHAVRKLFEFRADPNIQTPDGRTALLDAIENEDLDMVRELRENNADLNVNGEVDSTSWWQFSRFLPRNFLRIRTELEKIGPCYAALHYAVVNGNPEIVRYLLENGAMINSRDGFGATPLYYAVKKGDIEMTRLLLSQGADPNIESGMKYSKRGNIFLLLLRGFLDSNSWWDIFWEFLRNATYHSDPNIPDVPRETPLQHAKNKGYLDIANELLANGAHPTNV